MDVGLSETQSLMRDSIREYLRNEVPLERVRRLEQEGGYDRDLWQYLQNAGYLGLPFPEDLGGSGGELTDLAVVLEELTRRSATVPFMETVVCALAASRHGDPAIGAELVRGVIEGRMTIAPAILEENHSYDDFSLAVHGPTMSGVKRFVDYGNVVSHHLVAALKGGGPAIYLVDAGSPGVSTRALANIGRTPQAHVTYSAVPVRRAGGMEAVRFLAQAACALAAVQCVGNAQQALDMTVSYVSNRVQFGQPLATFQAVQHHCANMAIMVEAARFLAYEAVWNVDSGTATDRSLAVAKAWASKAATEVPMQAHQLHGGIGITDEYGLHFFSRRGKERALAWGTSEECLRALAGSIEEPEPWL